MRCSTCSPLGKNPGLIRFSQGSLLALRLRTDSWSHQGCSASASQGGSMGDGLIPGPFPDTPSPTPSSSPTYTRPSAKGLSLGSTMLTTESLQQTVSCSPFPNPGVLIMAAEGWCFPPYKISETRPTTPSQSAPGIGVGREAHAYRPEIPRPLKVLAMMAVGWCLAWPKALHSSSTLCPSTMIACQLGRERGE